MSLVLLNVKLCGKGNILEKVVLFAGGWQEKSCCLLVRISIGFPLNYFLSQDRYQIHMHFKGMKRVLTFRSLAVDYFTAHCIK